MVERNLAKVEVESSRLFSRSKIQKGSSQGFPFSLAMAPFQTLQTATKLVQYRANWRIRGYNTHPRRGSKVVMQRPAKPCTPVRFRPPPPYSKRLLVIVAAIFLAKWAKDFCPLYAWMKKFVHLALIRFKIQNGCLQGSRFFSTDFF